MWNLFDPFLFLSLLPATFLVPLSCQLTSSCSVALIVLRFPISTPLLRPYEASLSGPLSSASNAAVTPFPAQALPWHTYPPSRQYRVVSPFPLIPVPRGSPVNNRCSLKRSAGLNSLFDPRYEALPRLSYKKLPYDPVPFLPCKLRNWSPFVEELFAA